MKPFISLVFTCFCLFNLNCSFGQQADIPKDTISYQAMENLSLLILAKDYHNLTKDDQLSLVLENFQSSLDKIKESLPTEFPYNIAYQYENKLEVSQNNIIKRFRISEANTLEAGFKNVATITDARSGYRVLVEFDDFTEILEADFQEILAIIKRDLPEKDRYQRYLEYGNDTQSNQIKLTENRSTGYLDMLTLQAGVGANVYRNKFLTDFTGEIGIQLNHKGILRNQFYVSNNLMFSFDPENNAVINNFTNVGFRRNFSNQRDKSNWLGVEFGTLTKRIGDIFQPNTMRIGLNWEAGKHITISPQLYFNGFFKQVSPGLRIGIGL